MERKITKCGVYIRKSREEETQETLQRQEAVLIELCKKNEWEYEIFREVGSSQDLDRAKLQEMLTKIKLFHFDGIVMADLDRLSRNTGHFAQIKEVFIGAGCVAITPNKIYDFTKQEDDLFSDLQSVLAKNEYQTIKRRLVRGARQSAKDGNWMGKKVPVGYVYDLSTKRLKLSNDAPIIKRMFEEYLNGMSTKDVAYQFTFENIITTDTKYPIIWTPSGVSRMLNNPVYYGCSVYGKTTNKNGKRGVKTDIEEQIIVEDTHEGIVDKEMWDKVQQIKLNRNSKPLVLKLGKRKFSGLISCGLCGRIQSFHTSRYKRKRITSCQTRHYNDNRKVYTMCENKGANIEDFEVLFYDSLKIYIDDLKNDIDLIKSTETKNVKNNESEISHIEKQIKRIDLDIKRVQQGYKVEIFTQDEAHSEIKNLKIQKDSLENRLIKLQEHDDNSNLSYVESVLNKLKRVYSGKDDLPEQEINDILREYIHSIIYKKTDEDNGEIKLRIIWKEIVSEG